MLFDPASNNRGENNQFYYTTMPGAQVRFLWNNTGYKDIDAFALTAGGTDSRYLTGSEMQSLLSTYG